MNEKRITRHIAIEGEFNIFTASAIRERLLAALDIADELEVDLGQVTDVDSAGLQLMIATKLEAQVRGKILRFLDRSTSLHDTLDLSDLTAQFAEVFQFQPAG